MMMQHMILFLLDMNKKKYHEVDQQMMNNGQ